jgi:drug/metabolite transporter (DMT)-like permease
MRKRRGILGNIGWGLAGDVLLFCTTLLFMSMFAFTSLSNAYLVALLVLAVVLIACVVYRRTRKKVDN